MYLEEIDLQRAPGIPHAIRLADMSQGLVLLVGPNASGKSTLGRTVMAMLWPKHPEPHVVAVGRWRMAPSGPLQEVRLVYGHAHWQGDEPGASEELASSWKLTLLDLLDVDASSDDLIARTIERELAGGYDLAAIRPTRKASMSPHRTAKKEHLEAGKSLRDLGLSLDTLAASEVQLKSLVAKAAEANKVPAGLQKIEDALRSVELGVVIKDLDEQLAALPRHVADVPHEASKTAKERESDVEKWRAQVDHRERQQEGCREACRTYAFPKGDPGRAAFGELENLSARLVSGGDKLESLQEKRDAASRKCHEAASLVWTDGRRTEFPSRGVVEQAAERAADLVTALACFEAVGEAPEPMSASLDPEEKEGLVNARSLLREWLTSPRATEGTQEAEQPGWTRFLVGVGAIVALVGLPFFLPGFSRWFGLLLALGCALVCLGLGIRWSAALASRRTGQSPSDAEVIAKRYRDRKGYPTVEEWSVRGVETVVAGLSAKLAVGERVAHELKEYEELSRRRSNAAANVEAIRRAMAEVCSDVGLEENLLPLSTAIQINRLAALGESLTDQAEATGAWESAYAAQERVMGQLRSRILELSLLDEGRSGVAFTSPEAASAVVKDATERHASWILAEEKLKDATAELEGARKEINLASERYDAHLERCGIDRDRADELPFLESQRVAMDELAGTRKEHASERKRIDASLPDALPEGVDALKAERERLTQLSETSSALHERIARIRTEIDNETQGTSMEEALRRVKRSEDGLVADRDAALGAVIEEGICSWLRDEGTGENAPALLASARQWFLRFTRNRYELQVLHGAGFVALDQHSGRQQRLSELSDGTRTQLLLAARLAFIERVEKGGPKTPLFLDEVLSISDPERFQAIASAVLELCAEGRQVFYATADQAEADEWRRIAAEEGHDEPELRLIGPDDALANWRPLPSPPVPRAPLPAPRGDNAIEYVAELELPRPTLHTQIEQWPLGLVLYDRLAVVHRAAEKGITRVGQVKLANKGIPLPLDDEEIALANGRAQAITAALVSLRVGRGRPVSWEAVIESGAISEKYVDAARDLCDRLGTDPNAFVEEVGSLRGFRSNKATQLREHLLEVGILDDRPALPWVKVVESAQVACGDTDGLISLVEIEGLVKMTADVVGIDAR